MKKTTAFGLVLAVTGGAILGRAQAPAAQPQAAQAPAARPPVPDPGPMPPGPDPNSQYRLGPDSLPQEGVPKGEIRGPYTLRSTVFPGTQHTYWVYVPAQYDPAVPAALMVYQDGQAFKYEQGDLRAQNVMDNLIYRHEIPVMIGVFINPGRTPEQPEPVPSDWGDRTTNRPTEYNTPDDKYARVITEELMPVVTKEYNISKDPEMHGIGGSSSGAIAAFAVAWERPNDFRKVLSNVGSFVGIRGGYVYPERVRASEKKPIRVFLCDGRNDHRGFRDGKYEETHDWFYQNVRLMKALTEKGYDVNYTWGMNLHGQKFGGAIMPEMMRWLWRDAPVSTDPNDMVERGFRQPAPRPTSTPANLADGEFTIRPPYTPAPELTVKVSVPKGALHEFTMKSVEGTIFPGSVPFDREVIVYVPAQYVPGTAAPFIVAQDGPGYLNTLPPVLDNLIHEKRLPVMIAIMVANGGPGGRGGNGRRGERSIEYDTVSDAYTRFVETEVLPRVVSETHVTLTKDPTGRATMGGSSGGAAAFTMAWFHPELYGRVLSYSGSFVNLENSQHPEISRGAWEYHATLISKAAPKPIRVWLEVGDNDNGATRTEAELRNWIIANQHMAATLKAKGYHYQYTFAENAGHTDRSVHAYTLPEALLWLWQGYPVK
jgi:enterochelin esterase family protein